MKQSYKKFTDTLLQWYEKHGRKHLPWQQPRDAYRVWLSEIMLQQTQVKTVIPYFERFIIHFPDVSSLANASEDKVLALWSGLGYYSRARNLHKTAQIIHSHFQDKFPSDLAQLTALPGIGPSTAAAIASLAFNQPTAILDGNVKRVLSRYFLIEGLPAKASTINKLWTIADECMSKTKCADYTQAIMDMGATCCTNKNPHCIACPLNTTCQAYQKNEVNNYPQKNIKTSLPTKEQCFLVLHTASSHIYLEKRPPVGIWGGLWCLPSIETLQNIELYLHEKYKLKITNTQELIKFKHSFSHFHLNISSFALQSEISKETIMETTGQWFALADLNSIGLAKPIRSIIEAFDRLYGDLIFS